MLFMIFTIIGLIGSLTNAISTDTFFLFFGLMLIADRLETAISVLKDIRDAGK